MFLLLCTHPPLQSRNSGQFELIFPEKTNFFDCKTSWFTAIAMGGPLNDLTAPQIDLVCMTGHTDDGDDGDDDDNDDNDGGDYNDDFAAAADDDDDEDEDDGDDDDKDDSDSGSINITRACNR